MSVLFAVDPGIDSGFAIFHDGTLIRCGNIRSKSAIQQAEDIIDHLPVTVSRIFDLVIERPVIYPVARAKADPNDLIELAIRVGVIMAHVPPPGRVIQVKPREWKGQVPKEIIADRVLAELSTEEARIVHHTKTKNHNTMDAVGIGLWQLGRLRK